MDGILLGLETALQPSNILICLLGVTLGTAVGVLPGIGPTATVALLLPITFEFDAVASLIMLAGIYYGAQYGGSTTAILLNLPGESSSVVTALDGHQMARQGRAGPALATAALGSFFAGTVGTIVLAAFAPPLAELALQFGPADYFADRRPRPDRERRARQRVDGQGARDDRARACCWARSGRTSSPASRASPSGSASSTAAWTSCRSRSACSASRRSSATSSRGTRPRS